MTTDRLHEWTDRCIAASPRFEPDEQRLLVATYGLLAETGRAVSTSQIATATGSTEERVAVRLRSWPLVIWDDQRRVVGIWGLHAQPIEPTHAMEVNGTTVYGWCALDTLFLTEILGVATTVTSVDPHDGTPIRLRLSPDGVTESHPPDLVMTLLLPDGDFGVDAIARYCHKIHFFTSADSADAWIGDRPGLFHVPVDDAFEAGRTLNRRRLGDVIHRPRRQAAG